MVVTPLPFAHTIPLTLLRKIQDIPWVFIIILSLLASIGFMMMYSAAGGNMHPWAWRQILHFLTFFPLMLTIALVDIRVWFRYAYVIYAISLLLILTVMLLGHTAKGGTRWINVGFFKMQPSEFMKIALVFALARYFHLLHPDNIKYPSFLVPPLLLIGIPFLLIAKQPDLGTALILLASGGIMLWLANIRWWKFVAVFAGAAAALPIIWHSGLLREYQKNRVLTFLSPERDPLGTGYNIIQSKIAIGSGGFTGKGIMQGSQSQLNFLPEHQTDFIFTMIAEELGFMGAATVILLSGLLTAYGITFAMQCKSYFGKLVAMGVTSIFFLHVCINIAMVMGLLPAVGIPLPLLSYGGTIMLTMMAGFGVIMNVHIHRSVSIGTSSII